MSQQYCCKTRKETHRCSSFSIEKLLGIQLKRKLEINGNPAIGGDCLYVSRFFYFFNLKGKLHSRPATTCLFTGCRGSLPHTRSSSVKFVCEVSFVAVQASVCAKPDWSEKPLVVSFVSVKLELRKKSEEKLSVWEEKRMEGLQKIRSL